MNETFAATYSPPHREMESFAPLDEGVDPYEMLERVQRNSEFDRTRLSRELHDEMGGLLVGALMDISFTQQNHQMDACVRQRLERVRGSLAQAIELKRGMIETLRPSMLDNFGLIAALKWEITQRCKQAGMNCRQSYPDGEPAFTQTAAIMVFRVVQETLLRALQRPGVKSVSVRVAISDGSLDIALTHDGQAFESKTRSLDDFIGLCLVAHRARALGGRMLVTAGEGGGEMYGVNIPLEGITEHRG